MIQKERLLKTFLALTAFNSPSYQERETADFLLERLRNLGIFPEEDGSASVIGGNTGNIYACIDGDIPNKPRLFSAHLDTVSPCKSKKVSLGEKITSDGTTVLGADDLAAVACILEAITVLREEKLAHGPIELLFSPAEEVYSKGANAFDYTKMKSKLAFVPDYDGSLGEAVNRAPTIISFSAQMRGKAAHAGFAPEKGISAIAAAARAVGKLKLGRIDEETTGNIGEIQGGVATNIVPESCTVKGEIRSYSHASALHQLAVVQDTFLGEGSCNFTYEICVHAYQTAETSGAVNIFKAACEKSQLPMTLVSSFGGSDNNTFAKKGIEGLVIASAMHRCHTTQEYTTAEELLKLCELLLNIILINDLEVEK
ncbi:MAG: M20/M25/M40 family metallo-hydrolase [Oscillospiraceae bacterium]